MKFLRFIFVFVLFTSSNSYAQLASGTIAPNFTLVDIDGTEDEGKKLFLKATNGLTTTTSPS